MTAYNRPSAGRRALAVLLNIFLGFTAIHWLSHYLMIAAARILNEDIAWPQMSFMSAYPDDARNGYLVFVFSVYLVVYLFSGFLGGIIGASPGKYLLGIRYVTVHTRKGLFYQMSVRSGLICLLLIPIFLFGPVLGFIFGSLADPISMLCLCFGMYFWITKTSPNQEDESWVDEKAKVRPVLLLKQ